VVRASGKEDEDMIGPLLWFLGYLTLGLLTARGAYGVQRARMIEQEGREFGALDPERRFRETGKEPAMTAALLYGLAWPLVLPVFLLGRLVTTVVTARPPSTGYERSLRAERSRRRIGELEQSLGIADQLPPGKQVRHGEQVHHRSGRAAPPRRRRGRRASA
jgi:hypothetical protein